MAKILNTLFKPIGREPETCKEVSTSYKRAPYFSEKLRFADYDAVSKTFLLDDGQSVGAIFELEDIASEARSKAFLEQLQKNFQGLFQDVFPQYFGEESPWLMQIYLQDEASLSEYRQQLHDYLKCEENKATNAFKKMMEEHIALMTKKEGLFTDTKVSGLTFRGKRRRIRVVIYRKLHLKARRPLKRTPIEDLALVSNALEVKLESVGIKVKRFTDEDFYRWMVTWFNPKPRAFQTAESLIQACPYPDNEDKPYGYDFSEQFFFNTPYSDMDGLWYFDGMPHHYLTILGLQHLPETGHLTAERNFGNRFHGLFDEFPEGSIFVITVALKAQAETLNHLDRIERSAERSSSERASMTREDCKTARRAIESGNYFFSTSLGVYLRGENNEDLANKEIEVEATLLKNGLRVLSGDYNLIQQESYLRYLPFGYDYRFDKSYLFRSRYLTGKQLAQLMPLYGRERGTNHPLFTFFNRGGEPLTLDPFNPKDKDFNSHLVLLGTTGSGKSATASFFMLSLMAIYKPRLVIVDMGNSFQLLGEYFKSLGLSVNRVEISFKDTSSLNPFAMSKKMLQQIAREKKRQEAMDVFYAAKEEALQQEMEALNASFHLDEMVEERDYLGEMVLSAELMVTGSDEEEKLTRQNRYFLLKAVIRGAEIAESEGRKQMLSVDLKNALLEQALQLEKENKKADMPIIKDLKKMAHHISLFCEDSLTAKYFNRAGDVWKDADVTILELGIFKEEGYEAQRALAFIGAMNHTMTLAEQTQYQNRMTVFFGDEIHNIIKKSMTAAAVIKCTKMSRKIGLWMWLSSQNVDDFPQYARKMLSMAEFWICLGMDEEELKKIEGFINLTEEERHLFRSVRKEAGKYVEGVLLCPRLKALFRSIPPREVLALAMTEKHEKAKREALMQQFHCSELEAAMKIAQALKENTRDA